MGMRIYSDEILLRNLRWGRGDTYKDEDYPKGFASAIYGLIDTYGVSDIAGGKMGFSGGLAEGVNLIDPTGLLFDMVRITHLGIDLYKDCTLDIKLIAAAPGRFSVLGRIDYRSVEKADYDTLLGREDITTPEAIEYYGGLFRYLKSMERVMFQGESRGVVFIDTLHGRDEQPALSYISNHLVDHELIQDSNDLSYLNLTASVDNPLATVKLFRSMETGYSVEAILATTGRVNRLMHIKDLMLEGYEVDTVAGKHRVTLKTNYSPRETTVITGRRLISEYVTDTLLGYGKLNRG